jgi:hypothetical protein
MMWLPVVESSQVPAVGGTIMGLICCLSGCDPSSPPKLQRKKANEPAPITVLEENYSAIMDYVSLVEEGKIGYRDGNRGYHLTELLHNNDVAYVRDDHGYIRLMFASPAPDPVEELIYCPNGHGGRPLPVFGSSQVRDLRFIDDKWVYCCRD